jgi:hypothetical protein
VFYFNQFLQNLSDQNFKNLILIRFKGIEANYLYVYQTNFIVKISHMKFLLLYFILMKPCDTKRQVTTQKK